MNEVHKVKVQYCRTKCKKDGCNSQNCRLPLTKSLIEQMGYYEGCEVNVEYDFETDKITISLIQD